MCNFVGSNGRSHLGAFVGSLSDLLTNIVGLSNHLDLDSNDRAELLKVVRDWVAIDHSRSFKFPA